MELKGTALTILKYLCSISYTITVGTLKANFLGNEFADFNEAKQYLINEGYIAIDGDGNITILQKGNDYIEEYDQFASDEIFEGNYDFAILKFLYQMNEPVHVFAFPKYIVTHAPHDGKGMTDEFHLQSYIQFNKDLSRYVDCINHSTFAINAMGKSYYLHLIDSSNRRLEIYNKPLVHLDYSTHTTGDNNKVVSHSDVKESFNKNEETPETKGIAKKGLTLNKWMLILAILAIVVMIAIAILQ